MDYNSPSKNMFKNDSHKPDVHQEFADYARPWTPAPGRTEKIILTIFLIVIVAFSAITINRGAFLSRPMTDAQVLFRGAWAIWSNAPLYEVSDDNGWHYHYPPTLAVLLRPFANAPKNRQNLSFTTSYPVSLFVWFALGFTALIYSIVLYGKSLDQNVLRTPLRHDFLHQWWLLRLGPLLAFAGYVGLGLGRGQVSALLLLSIAGFSMCYSDRRPVAAGLWLSLGIVLKIFPAIMILLPILRRDWLCLASVALGSFIGLFAIPALLIGPSDTLLLYNQWLTERIFIIASVGIDGIIHGEMSPLSSDAMGFGPVVLRLSNLTLGAPFSELLNWMTWAHWICSILVLALILWAGLGRVWTFRREQPNHASAQLLFAALIASASVPMVTVSQTHYFTLGIPLYMFLVADDWRCAGATGLNTKHFAFAVLLWLAFLLLELNRPPLSTIGWPTIVMIGLVTYGSFKLRSLDCHRKESG
jgi:hypothetical protein